MPNKLTLKSVLKRIRMLCFFVSDLHGNPARFEKLFHLIKLEKPKAVFIGGDVLPSGLYAFTSQLAEPQQFVDELIRPGLQDLKTQLN